MKKTSFAVITILLLLLIPCTAGDKKTLLVLGFSSPVMNEIEERFMREEVLRELARKGSPIVSVMGTEELIRSRQNFEPVAVGEKEAGKLARRAGASLVVTGKLLCVEGSKKKRAVSIAKGHLYRCTVTLFYPEGGKKEVFSLTRKGDNNRYRFIRALSRDIAEALLGKSFS